MKYLILVILFYGCTPQTEPGINLNDWSEQTRSTKNHMPRDTYDVVILYNGDRPNDTLFKTVYSHYPTSKDIQPDYLTSVPSFKAPDNEHARLYLNVKDVRVIAIHSFNNNREYIQSLIDKQEGK